MTLSSEFRDIGNELFDDGLPGVVTATYDDGASSIKGRLARSYVETDRISGIRSTFLCAIDDAVDIAEGDELVADGITFTVEIKEREGIVLERLILSR